MSAPLAATDVPVQNDRLKQLLSEYPDLVTDADEYCWEMLGKARLHSFEAGTLLFTEGMECKHLMLITEGNVRVFNESEDGREITLYRVRPGQLCIHNLNNLVDGISFPVMARTESYMQGLVIPRLAFHEALENSSTFRQYVLRTLTERLSHMVNLVSGFAFERLDLRLACWLIEQFEQNCGRPICVTHSEIALELGTTREMISRILKDFERKRCIQLHRSKIHLLCKHTLHLVSKNRNKGK